MTLAEMICMAIFSISMPNADFACEHMETVVEYSEKYDKSDEAGKKERIFEVTCNIKHIEALWCITLISESQHLPMSF